jgi:hypothetical protein
MARNPLLLPVGPWLPDMPDLGNPGSPNVRNALPRTPNSYGPVPQPMPYSNALTARCQGAAAFLDALGNVNLFSGDATNLYQMVSGSAAWNVVSKAPAAYSTPSDGQWNFEYYNGIALATNFSDPIQAFQLGVSADFADLAGTPPRARYMAFIRGFLMLLNTFDAVSAEQPQRGWWSGFGDPTSWPTPGTSAAAQAQSSFNDFLGSFGWGQGVVGNLGNADGLLFFERAVFRVLYAGPPAVFDFPPAEGVRGTPAPNSIVQYGNLAYYLGEDGFYANDGLNSTPIGANKVDKYFFADVDAGFFDRIKGTVDPVNKQIIWAYPGQGNNGGLCNHLLIYNWQLDRWSIVDTETETIARLLSIGYTLDELFTVLGYTLDTLPAPLDSRIWTGGQVNLGVFDNTHKLNFLTGSNFAPTVDTTEGQPFRPKRTRITGARPLVDGGVPSVAIGKRERLVDPVTFTSSVAMNALGKCPVRTSGRYTRGRITLPAGSSFSNILGVELEGDEAGNR